MAGMRNIIAHMEQTIPLYDNTYLMVSGGVDSMVLLDLMLRRGFKFEVIHFQHHIRDNDHLEGELIQKVLTGTDIKYHHGHGIDIPDTNVEAEAHDQRWTFVKRVLKGTSNLVITAHNLNDNIEQVFLSLMRGKPHDSLNMTTLSFHREMVRYKPLLSVEKEEIYRMAKSRNLEWIEDLSNGDEKYTRNMVRGMITQLNTKVNIVKAMSKSLLGVEC